MNGKFVNLLILSTFFLINVDAMSPLLEDPLLQQDPWAFPLPGKVLSEKAKTFVFTLDTLPKQDKVTWIRTKQDIQALLPLSLKSFAEVFLDFPSQVAYMPRLAKITMLKQDGGLYEVRQRYEIHILGYTYPTEYDMRYEYREYPELRRAEIRWHLLDSDGSIGGSEGGWFMEEVFTAAGPAVKVRNLNVGLVRKDFPLQAQIMNLVGPGELEGIVSALYKEAKRRGLQ
ncbi:hypothetical protein [Gracilinema caldarium]|uniref:Coenzyme Q-binding protein COQ10 START domain-containing protein n=1 Tax=Gracilinema caldarium (strain ATCC 51460 / DSM 7334 / H1) TaxID=744872 RepID=F8EY36_GRAC1|nr:hypothetical protein [Gracilinema caldarium]AEJ20697.1 hypothetical protein Spica_2596 [Gracilinema caldarium DSM 7334]